MENIPTTAGPRPDAISKPFSTQDRYLDIPETSGRHAPWVVNGIAFPSGTRFRGVYKGYVYHGNVRHGALMLDGKKFLSPCAAAITITRNPVDGWLFWDCKQPGQTSWESIYEIKRQNNI